MTEEQITYFNGLCCADDGGGGGGGGGGCQPTDIHDAEPVYKLSEIPINHGWEKIVHSITGTGPYSLDALPYIYNGYAFVYYVLSGNTITINIKDPATTPFDPAALVPLHYKVQGCAEPSEYNGILKWLE